MAISEEDIEAANRRAVQTKAKHAVATKVRYDARRKRIVLHLESGVELAFAPHLAQGLEGASAADLAGAQISPSGLGLHFPALDADLYLPGLLDGLFGSRRWIAAQTDALAARPKARLKRRLRAAMARGVGDRKIRFPPESSPPHASITRRVNCSK